MKVLTKGELTVLQAILDQTPRAVRLADRSNSATIEAAKLRGAVGVRHVNEVLDNLGHPRPAGADSFGQAIERLGDKIVLALLVGVPHSTAKGSVGPNITGTIGDAIAKHITQHNGGHVITDGDDEETGA